MKVRRMKGRAGLLPALLGASLLAGCALGPQHPTTDLPMPPPEASRSFGAAGSGMQALNTGEVTPPDWWTRFGSPALNALVARALAANEDLAVAQANLRQAQAGAGVARGDAGPQIDAGLTFERDRLSHTLSSPLVDPAPTVYSLHTANVSVSYPLDLFGLQRSEVRSAKAQAEVACQQLLAARLTVADSVVLAVIEQASLRAQIDGASLSVGNYERITQLLKRREQIGDVGAREVAAEEAALAQARGALAALQRTLAEQDAALGVLLGIAPGNPLPDLPGLDDLALPDDLPIGLPAQIVAQRPDLRAADAAMVAAGANVGTAIAARLPQITLGASAGGTATNFAEMFASGNPFWSLLGGITAPIFHSGALKKQQEGAEAALDAAKARYRLAALHAFEEVGNALTALDTDVSAYAAAEQGAAAADKSLAFTRRQAQLGNIDSLALLNASSQNAQAAQALVEARAIRLADTAALFQATGGGVEEVGPANAPPSPQHRESGT
ncbi:efflux transporter outer membrane subunit [Novosphingobium profundi]|uniref:efflux transporter outer membrane subunit n=1 Tax=Novosphingobium profundi TaxID=1774954 RepID=UPI001FE703F7|nr:efflux transporter outer membrane subunit [Novosphingobium profundi]